MVFLGREIAEQKDYGDKVADEIDEEIHRIIQSAHRVAKKILTKNKLKLKRVAEELIAKETLEGVALEALFSESAADAPAATATPTSRPATASAETKPKPVSKKAGVSPQLVPKPASS